MTFRLNGFEIRGFGPFDRGYSVDLTTLGPNDRVVAICGENGVGKTTAFELATAGAMYRETPTRGSLVDLATSRDAFLESRFTNGQDWTVRHMVDAVSRKSEALVLDADGLPVLPDSKVAHFDKWAAKTLPSPAVFFATILTPQGAGGFAKAKPAARKDVLLTILGPETEQLEGDAVHAREQVKAAKAALATLEARIADEKARGGDVASLEDILVWSRTDVDNAATLLETLRSELAAAEQSARDRKAAEEAARVVESDRVILTGDLKLAHENVDALEKRAANNRAVLADAEAIRAAEARLPVLRAEISKLMIRMAKAYADMNSHGVAAAEAAKVEATARQRAETAKARLEKASAAQGRAHKLEELREALKKAERDVTDDRETLDRLRGKRLAGTEERLEAAIDTLDTIALGDDDPKGLAQARLDANARQVEEARDLPAQIAAYEQSLRDNEATASALARDVRSCELSAQDANDLPAAAEEFEAAMAGLEDASTRRLEATEAARLASLEHSELGAALGPLQLEVEGVEALAKKAGPLGNAEARLAELTPQIEAGKADVLRFETALTALPAPAPLPPAPDVAGAHRAFQNAEASLTEAHRKVATAEQQLAQAQASTARLVALETERAAAEAELADWTRIAADLGRDGLQAMVIDGAIPEINEAANTLLHAAFGTRFTIDVRTQAADAKGKRLLETLDVWVIDTGTDQHKGREGLIESFSGGEVTILAEALSLALTQLACRLAGAERPTLIRDESAGQLSEGNAPIWMAMLRRAAEIINVDRILFVNHNRQTWDLADARIEVRS